MLQSRYDKKKGESGITVPRLATMGREEHRPLGLRVDVDTHAGMRDGVPVILELLREAGVKATFYLAFGPDRSGRAIFNVFRRPGFLRKMLRTGAPKVYGLRTMLSGTLLPSRRIAAAFPVLARQIVSQGHEVGVHAWDHRAWQDGLRRFSYARMTRELARGASAYRAVYGKAPETFASPAWLCSDDSLGYQDTLGLLYGSDCRGTAPFYPVIEGRVLKTIQVPTTLPTLDEGIGERDPDASSFFQRVLDLASESSWPVLTIHAELEGGPYASCLTEFLSEAKIRGFRVVPLRELLGSRLSDGEDLPRCTMTYGLIKGRSGVVSLQHLKE